jgi:hypothetical protein
MFLFNLKLGLTYLNNSLNKNEKIIHEVLKKGDKNNKKPLFYQNYSIF